MLYFILVLVLAALSYYFYSETHTLSVSFYDINGDKVAEHDAPWPSCYDKQNTIKLTF